MRYTVASRWMVGALLLAGGWSCAGGGDEDTGPSDVPSATTGSWSISFGTPGNGLNVSACGVSINGGFCSQPITVNAAGAFNDTWSVTTPNVVRAEGTLTATTLTATLQCVSTAASGTMSATFGGAEYAGSATLSGATVPIRVVRGTASGC